MHSLVSHVRATLGALLILPLVLCGLYPLTVWGIARLAFPAQSQGSLLHDARGTVLGSSLLGQEFTGAGYFHPRPSAAGKGYDATASGGSNLGPTSRQLRDLIRERIDTYRNVNGLAATVPIPADAVTASGSGLDPHISPRNAELQAPRVARARGLSTETVRNLIAQHTDPPSLGILGEPGVNVPRLNLALDKLR